LEGNLAISVTANCETPGCYLLYLSIPLGYYGGLAAIWHGRDLNSKS